MWEGSVLFYTSGAGALFGRDVHPRPGHLDSALFLSVFMASCVEGCALPTSLLAQWLVVLAGSGGGRGATSDPHSFVCAVSQLIHLGRWHRYFAVAVTVHCSRVCVTSESGAGGGKPKVSSLLKHGLFQYYFASFSKTA